jgi:hypothetical protein
LLSRCREASTACKAMVTTSLEWRPHQAILRGSHVCVAVVELAGRVPVLSPKRYTSLQRVSLVSQLGPQSSTTNVTGAMNPSQGSSPAAVPHGGMNQEAELHGANGNVSAGAPWHQKTRTCKCRVRMVQAKGCGKLHRHTCWVGPKAAFKSFRLSVRRVLIPHPAPAMDGGPSQGGVESVWAGQPTMRSRQLPCTSVTPLATSSTTPWLCSARTADPRLVRLPSPTSSQTALCSGDAMCHASSQCMREPHVLQPGQLKWHSWYAEAAVSSACLHA